MLFLDEVGNRLRGHGQSRPNEMVAEKVEAAIDPVDECCGAYVGSWPIALKKAFGSIPVCPIEPCTIAFTR
jgi:hypothetical protein